MTTLKHPIIPCEDSGNELNHYFPTENTVNFYDNNDMFFLMFVYRKDYEIIKNKLHVLKH